MQRHAIMPPLLPTLKLWRNYPHRIISNETVVDRHARNEHRRKTLDLLILNYRLCSLQSSISNLSVQSVEHKRKTVNWLLDSEIIVLQYKLSIYSK